jgi:hypothetical protein
MMLTLLCNFCGFRVFINIIAVYLYLWHDLLCCVLRRMLVALPNCFVSTYMLVLAAALTVVLFMLLSVVSDKYALSCVVLFFCICARMCWMIYNNIELIYACSFLEKSIPFSFLLSWAIGYLVVII